jgi:hypothetical protein
LILVSRESFTASRLPLLDTNVSLYDRTFALINWITGVEMKAQDLLAKVGQTQQRLAKAGVAKVREIAMPIKVVAAKEKGNPAQEYVLLEATTNCQLPDAKQICRQFF